MNELEEEFWDTAIAEAATGKRPPDQAARILARLNAEPDAPAMKARRRWVRYPLEAAAAAILVAAIGFATGLLKWPGGDDPTPREAVADRKWAAGPGSVVVETRTGLRLERGWVLLQPGAPDVQCGESVLSKIDGLVLAHEGAAPTEEQLAAAQDWLRNNQVEADMLNAKKWVAGLAMAVLVFNGSVILDGQEAKPEQPAPAQLHVITSVMDIDLLPPDAKRVSIAGQSCMLLDFLVKRESIEELDMSNTTDMNSEYARALQKLPLLRSLTMGNAKWSGLADYSALESMTTLKHLVIDPLPLNGFPDEKHNRDFREQQTSVTLGVLSKLQSRGVEIILTAVDARRLPLELLLEMLPKLTELTVSNADDGDLKLLSEVPTLRSLIAHARACTDIGLAYLVLHGSITDLTLWGIGVDTAAWYQLGRMKSLRYLAVSGVISKDPTEAFKYLTNLPNLEHLSISGLRPYSYQDVLRNGARLLDLPIVSHLEYDPSTFSNGWEMLPRLKAKKVEVWHRWGDAPTLNADQPIVGDATSVVEVLVIHFYLFNQYHKFEGAGLLQEVMPAISACPNLKRVEVKQLANVGSEQVEPFLQQLRKAVPKAKVEYVQ